MKHKIRTLAVLSSRDDAKLYLDELRMSPCHRPSKAHDATANHLESEHQHEE